MKTLENSPKIYVGTYGMYNDGSLFGQWMELSNYSNREEFYKACYEFHSNEFDPELMFQDWEYIPDFLISESSLHENTYKYFEAVADMDASRAEAFELYCRNINCWPENCSDLDDQVDGFNESYQGYYGGVMKDAKIEFTYQYVEDTGLLQGVPEIVERYFDYEAYGRDLFLEGYSDYEGHIFLDL